MPLVVNNDAEQIFLEMIFNQASPPTYYSIRLYTNDQTPAENDESGNFTECNVTDYVAWDTTPSNWTITNSAGTSYASHAMHTYTIGAATTIYGYFVTDGSGGNGQLYWAERFATPAVFGSEGGTLDLTPRVELD